MSKYECMFVQTLADYSVGTQPVKNTCMKDQKNNLMNVSDVMAELGLNRNDRAWRTIRKTLIIEYGMTRIGDSGYRIPRRNLERFIEETYRC